MKPEDLRGEIHVTCHSYYSQIRIILNRRLEYIKRHYERIVFHTRESSLFFFLQNVCLARSEDLKAGETGRYRAFETGLFEEGRARHLLSK